MKCFYCTAFIREKTQLSLKIWSSAKYILWKEIEFFTLLSTSRYLFVVSSLKHIRLKKKPNVIHEEWYFLFDFTIKLNTFRNKHAFACGFKLCIRRTLNINGAGPSWFRSQTLNLNWWFLQFAQFQQSEAKVKMDNWKSDRF